MTDIDAIRARLDAYDDAQARPCGLRVYRVLAFGDETPDGQEVRYDAGPCRRVAGHDGPCSESLVRPLFGVGAIRVLLAEVDALRQRLDVATAATEPALLNAIAALVDAADRASSRSKAMRAAQEEGRRLLSALHAETAAPCSPDDGT